MAVALAPSVNIYHIKQQGLHEFQTLDIRGCYMVKFSNGGHLLACVFSKEIRLYQSFNLMAYKSIGIG